MNASEFKRWLAARGCTFAAGPQMTYRYTLAFEPDDNGTVLVTSPDFPPLVTFGENEADARRHALDALLSLVASMIAAGERVPSPSQSHTGPLIELPLLVSLKIELHNSMLARGMSRDVLRQRLGWPDGAVDRLLRPTHSSRVQDIEAAFRAMGQDLSIEAKPDALIA